MSYIVLARQYRPKNFAQMVGQDHVVQALSNALKSKRLHHAYLFTGTRGVGKTTISRILAKSLNCIGPDGLGDITHEPCGICQACQDIDAGRFTDYIELDAASNRGVDEISQLLEQAVYKPVAGRFKVFMIDEVHMLSNTAFNAMLKTLEEPPEYLKFVLATTDPQKVPVTVLSRCLQFNLRSMAPETISEHLQNVLTHEQIPFDAGSLRLISRSARGSMRDALSLTDQAIAYGSGTIKEQAIRQMIGSVDQSYIYQIIQAIAQGQGAMVVELVNHMRTQSLAPDAALEEIANVLQRMAILRVAPDTLNTDDPDDTQINALIPLLEPDEVQLLYSIVLHGQTELGLASDEYAALVMILLRMLAFKPHQPSLQTGSSPESAEKKTESLNQAAQTSSTDKAQTISSVDKPTLNTDEKVPCNTLSSQQTQHAPEPHGFAPKERSPIVANMPPSVEDDLPPWAIEPVPETTEPSLPPGKEPEKNFSHLSQTDTPAHKSEMLSADQQTNLRDTPNTTIQSQSEEDKAPIHDPILFREVSPEVLRWEQVAKRLTEDELLIALARELVMNAQIESISPNEEEWHFTCSRQILLSDANQSKVSAAMQTLLGHPVHVSFASGQTSDTPALRLLAEIRRKQQAAEEAAANDPNIQRWLQDFAGAKIIPGSTKAI